MKSLSDELREYNIPEVKIRDIVEALNGGKIVRNPCASIARIFINDDSKAELSIVGVDGRERAIVCEWAVR